MDLRNIPLFGAMTRRMDWLSQRQRILSQNVANSDTPGYRPSDLKPVNFADQFNKLKMAGTSSVHITEGTVKNGAFGNEKQKTVYEEAPAGNAVNLEEQMVKVADTQMDYETMTTLYQRSIGMIRTALGKGR